MIMKPAITVFIVDDHSLVRTGIKKILESEKKISVIGEASSGEEAKQQVEKMKPNVVLMDIRMPGIGGLQTTIDLRRICPDTKIVIVTVCDDEVFTKRLLVAGAHGYITKDASSTEMIHAIQVVVRGEKYLSPSIARKIALLHLSESEDSPFESLSERELQVTIMISNGYRVQQVADELFLSPKTVNSYRYRIFEKLGISNDVELARLAIKQGLIEEIKSES